VEFIFATEDREKQLWGRLLFFSMKKKGGKKEIRNGKQKLREEEE